MKKVYFVLFSIYFVIVTFIFLLVAQKSQVEATQNHHHGPYPTVSPTHTPTPTIAPCNEDVCIGEHHCYECLNSNCKKEEAKEVDCGEEPAQTPTPEQPKVDAGSDGRHSDAPPMPKAGDVVCTTEKPTEAYGLYGESIEGGFRLHWTKGTDGTQQTLFYGKTKENPVEFGYPEVLGKDVESVDVLAKGWNHVFFKVVTWRGNCTADSIVGDP